MMYTTCSWNVLDFKRHGRAKFEQHKHGYISQTAFNTSVRNVKANIYKEKNTSNLSISLPVYRALGM